MLCNQSGISGNGGTIGGGINWGIDGACGAELKQLMFSVTLYPCTKSVVVIVTQR